MFVRTMNSPTGTRAGSWPRTAVIGLLVGAFLVGCSNDDDDITITDPVVSRGACADCHTDRDRLEALAIPDEPPDEPPGEG